MIKNNSYPHKRIILYSLTLAAIMAMTAGCKKSPEKIDLSSTHTTAAETMVSRTESATRASSPETSKAAVEADSDSGNNAKKISAEMNTYSSGQVSIDYPHVINMEDSEKASAIDALLKKNALSVLEALDIQEAEDTMKISCQVLSADRNRITAVYTGTLTRKDTSDPVNIMYSNTIDVSKVSDIGFERFADPYTMAGYVLSGDCTFYNTDEGKKALLMKAKNEISLEAYTDMFTNADFPFEGPFPQSFSYEHQGVIYFSIPVSHELGDYAIVMYAPDSK